VYTLPCFHLKGNNIGNNLTPRNDYYIAAAATAATAAKVACMLEWNTYGTHSEGMVFIFATQFFF
jgi:hypothetical protein